MRAERWRGWLALVCSSLAMACTAAPEEPVGRPRGMTATRNLSGEGEARVRGFVQTLDTSRFDPGQGAAETFESGLRKVRGAAGVFAFDEVTGAVIASRSSGPMPLPYSGSGGLHNSEVRAYLVSAGIPAEQVASAVVHTALRGSGPAGETPSVGSMEFAAYSTVLSRHVEGVGVAESIAWAELDGAGRVVAETIYWPELPVAALESARAFRDVLKDPARAAAYLRALPSDLEEGRVVIHHTPMTYRIPRAWRVTYDASPSSGPRSGVRYFDQAGTEYAVPISDGIPAQRVADAPGGRK